MKIKNSIFAKKYNAMKKIHNPFIISGITNSEYFCDRENELQILLSNVQNGVNTTLISPRRMGKTGLILRLFDEISIKKYPFYTLYLDIYASRSMSDFVKIMAEAVLKQFPEKSSIGKQFLKWLKGFRPLLSYDAVSGAPQVSILYQLPEEKENTLYGLLEFLNNQKIDIVIAIDEFQQITTYPEKNMEALLRTYLQQFPYLHFIFCGSKKSMIVDIFSNSKRPFYASTQYLSLEEIPADIYADFIKRMFLNNGISIEQEALIFILTWSWRHTFYTQCLCNKVFSFHKKNINIEMVKSACNQLLEQNIPVYLQYRQLLTSAQWNFLIAVAKEEKISQITAQKFISTHEIGTPANAKRICKALIENELILEIQDKRTTTYRIYDVFLSKWLKSEY